ncbi:MAG: hypothetical protein WC974_07405 [Thermoplasmata archaeon]
MKSERIGYKWMAPILILSILMGVFAVVNVGTITVKADTILSITPSKTSATIGETINISVNTTNLSGNNLTFKIINGTGAIVVNQTSNITDNTTYYNWNTTGVAAGVYTMNATINDTTYGTTNITLTAPVLVGPTANVVIGSVTTDKTQYTEGDTVTVTVKVNNTGNASGYTTLLVKIGADIIVINENMTVANNTEITKNGTWTAKTGDNQKATATLNGTESKNATFNVKAKEQPAKGFLPGFEIVLLGVTLIGAVLIIGRRKK